MSTINDTEFLNSNDDENFVNQHIQNFEIRSAEIGKGTTIKRALPNRQKRMIGAWCFLDHAGPVTFSQGDGLDVGPHPHIGLQTFTWMLEGTMLHSDSIGTKNQLIQPKQVNLMTAGYGISHTEVAPDTETKMHAAQLWIALPDDKRNMAPQFDHYPELPITQQDGIEFTVLVGEFLKVHSPVAVHSDLLGVDLYAQHSAKTTLKLNPKFEYGLIALEGAATVNGHTLNIQNMITLDVGLTEIELQIHAESRVLLLGGEPFESPILLWWNFVGRTQDEITKARDQWINEDERFGEISHYVGSRMKAPVLPDRMKASK